MFSTRQEDDDTENDELGLSLRVASSCSEVERGGDERNKEKREEMRGFGDQSQLHGNNLTGIMNNITSAPNKRARVSVRARCEAATVSSRINPYFNFCH